MANRSSQRFYEQGKSSRFRGLDIDAANELLAVLDAALSLKDLSPLKSVGLYKLTGNRKGQWAMTVNGPMANLLYIQKGRRIQRRNH